MTTNPDTDTTVARIDRLIRNVETVLHGKAEAIALAVVGILSEGHVLVEDVPGTGKTTLARALARSLHAEFRRVQFTSDMLPADVLGVSIWSSREESFRFTPGPIFANIVLADELNRTTPRTQSCLLECMSEGRVSVDGLTRELPDPFFVIATQNPVEFEGTYPLPESQLDRFLLRIRMGYAGRKAERTMLDRRTEGDPLGGLGPVLDIGELQEMVRSVRAVKMTEEVREYLLDLVEATRVAPALHLGASPRATLGLFRAARALALTEGRNYCLPDDVKRLFLPVLGHRVLVSAGDGEDTAEEVLAEIVEKAPVPA